MVALVFVGLPFVVRTVEPVLRDLAREAEEAAATLGATRGADAARGSCCRRWRRRCWPASALAFARAVGEYGSVIFIAGNMPMVSEIAPLLIVIRLEQFDYAGAAALGLAMLLLSFAVLLVLNLLQRAAAPGPRMSGAARRIDAPRWAALAARRPGAAGRRSLLLPAAGRGVRRGAAARLPAGAGGARRTRTRSPPSG